MRTSQGGFQRCSSHDLPEQWRRSQPCSYEVSKGDFADAFADDTCWSFGRLEPGEPNANHEFQAVSISWLFTWDAFNDVFSPH